MEINGKERQVNYYALPRAPENVFRRRFDGGLDDEKESVLEDGIAERVSRSSTLVEWTNRFDLRVEYTVRIVHGILNISNLTLAECLMPKALYRRRFCVVDETVASIYGSSLETYFRYHHVEFQSIILRGGEENKTMEAVQQIMDALCAFKLHRREPIIAIGGGVVLDVAGLAASLYRRGVPYIRIPTTLLAIVDASVGVKTGVDYVHRGTDQVFKNRMGTFYAPIAAWLDKSFIATESERHVVNGLGEIMKLALVRSGELFQLLEIHAGALIDDRFQMTGVADRVIGMSVEIMLEELGPNLWEQNLERCVDYGHTFSKLLEMKRWGQLLHGEAVNMDSALCILLSEQRGWLSSAQRDRIFRVMTRECRLPIYDPLCDDLELMWQAIMDGVEHRNGLQRIPLVRDHIGSSICVDDVTREQLEAAIRALRSLAMQYPLGKASR